MKSPHYALCQDGMVISWHYTISDVLRVMNHANKHHSPGHYQHNATHGAAPEFVRREYAQHEAPRLLAQFDPVI